MAMASAPHAAMLRMAQAELATTREIAASSVLLAILRHVRGQRLGDVFQRWQEAVGRQETRSQVIARTHAHARAARTHAQWHFDHTVCGRVPGHPAGARSRRAARTLLEP